MPPKKLKDLAEAPVYKMSHEEQVQLLSDALLREYMHRRGFRATLKAFDEEHPRDSNTISSRAVMSDLMALQTDDQQRMKGEGVETIMEMLCELRVERRVQAEALTAEAQAPLPRVPVNYDVLEEKLSKRASRAAKASKHNKSKKKESTSANDRADDTDGERRRRPKVRSTHADTRGAASRTAAAGMSIDDLLGSSHSSDSSDGADSEKDEGRAPAQAVSARGKEGHRNSDTTPGRQGSTGPSSAHAASAKAGSAPVQPAWMELEKSAAKKRESAPESDTSSDGSDNDEGGAESLGGGAAVSAELHDELSAAFQLLCGFDGGLPRAFLEQGFTFDEDLDCALIQWRPGGCDAVIAPVQAFVAAFFYEREVYVAKEQRQKDCLLRALCTILEQAQPNPSKIILLDGTWKLKKGSTRLTRADLRQQADTTRARCWTRLTSMEEVREVLRSTLLEEGRWMKPQGCGLLNFVFSLLLSRGVDAVRKEVSATAPATGDRLSLLSAATDGCASFALANLVLSGRATSHQHNGMQRGHQMGYAGKLKCGMLVGDPVRVDGDATLPASAYTHAMEPVLPSWVVRHKDHYANLYMTKDTRQVFQQKLNLGGSATEDVVYWDAATEDDAFVLSLTVRSITLGIGSGGAARNANSFVNTAITSVPVWSSAEVNWNGEAPLRD